MSHRAWHQAQPRHRTTARAVGLLDLGPTLGSSEENQLPPWYLIGRGNQWSGGVTFQ